MGKVQVLAMLRTTLLAGALAASTLVPGVARAEKPSNADQMSLRVVELVNVERAKAGLPALAFNPALATAAQGYAEVLAPGTCFDHTCGPVSDMRQRIENAGYAGWTSIGENIAGGYATAEQVVAGWMQSEGHRANILNRTYTEIGVGVFNGSGQFKTYWTQNFGARRGGVAAPAPAFRPLPEAELAAAPAPAPEAAPAEEVPAEEWGEGGE